MVAVKLSAIVDENRRLVIDVPAEIPSGDVEIIIRPAEHVEDIQPKTAREIAYAVLLAANALVTDVDAPPDIRPLSPEELLEIGELPEDALPSLDLINEDRGTL